MTATQCQCRDPGCPVCSGLCRQPADSALFRVDMEDRTGTPMCAGCADDAMECGLFTTNDPDDDPFAAW